MESHFRTWVSLLLLFIAIACMGSAAHSAETRASSAQKAYSPFDEPRPNIPQEIIDDKRLDQKVKVFVKSKNLHDLFGDLSTKTGVKITASRKLWGERPIIYFHSRPIRDVMTEISGLYGYRWLISGKPGAYEYEMFEDIRHAKRRSEAEKEMKAAQDRILLDLAKMCMEDDKTIDRLAKMGDGDYVSMFGPTLKDTSRMFSRFGLDFLREVLQNGAVDCKVSDLPLEWQQAECDWRNAICRRARASYEARGETPPEKLNDCTLANMAPTMFTVRRSRGLYGMPAFSIHVATLQGGVGASFGSIFTWPSGRLSEDEAREVAGQDVPKKILSDVPLPDEPKITEDKLRLLAFKRGLLVGDVLEAIARQSGLDAVADYHFRDETMEAFKAVPLRQTVETICGTFGYTCQVEKQTLRFRFNKWFTEPIPVEPPSDLVERLWEVIEQKGRAVIGDLREFASLPDTQIKWPGFKYMTGCDAAAQCPAALRLWVSLSQADVSMARSDAGLPVSQFSPLQRDKLDTWVRAMKTIASDDEIERSLMRAYTSSLDYGWPEAGTGENLRLVLPDRNECRESIDFPPPLKPDDRKALTAQRKADAEADVIEVLH